jgi:hypothetical protein
VGYQFKQDGAIGRERHRMKGITIKEQRLDAAIMLPAQYISIRAE